MAADGERRVRVQAEGQSATTRVHLVRRIACPGIEGVPPSLSLLECELLTGRTHQIRVHLAQAGFPILGDQKYGDFALNKLLGRLGHKRMFLHAFRLSGEHPSRGQALAGRKPVAGGFPAA